MSRKISSRKLALGLSAMCLLCASTGWAQSAEGNFTCQPGSGVWHNEAGHTVLSGAICTRDEEEGIYRLDFESENGKHAFAPSFASAPGTLRTLDEIGDVIFYADDDNVYAVSRQTFKVTWTQHWSGAERLPKSPDIRLTAFLVDGTDENGADQTYLKVLSVENNRVVEKMSAPIDRAEVYAFVWQADRLVSIGKTQLTWWPRQGVAFEPPVFVKYHKPLVDQANSHLDEGGLLVVDRDSNKIEYYRFDTRSRTTAHLNATAAVRGIGGSDARAMGVTSDLNIVRIVARMGSVLQNRYEAKYWRVREDAPMILADGNTLVLDGGDDNKAQAIDTTAMTWKRMALMDYHSPGRLALLKNNVLTTIHENGDVALVRWNAANGERVATLPFSAFDAIGGRGQWPRIERVATIPGVENYQILELNRPTSVNPELAFVILDVAKMKLVPDATLFHAQKVVDGLPSSLTPSENGFVLANEQTRAEWFVFDDKKQSIQNPKLAQMPTSPAAEKLSTQEKWYGYCDAENNCVVPATTFNEENFVSNTARQNAWTPELKSAPDHHAPVLAWFISIFAFIAMIGVTLWRNGLFAKSQLRPSSSTDTAFTSTIMEILDERNRRFITERDRTSFLAPSFVSQTWFRVLLSIVVGTLVGIGTTYRFVNDDSSSVFLAWCIISALPAMAVIWVILSWNFWNRAYLMRFGKFVEGEWLNCAKPNQSIAYTAEDGKTYELSRHQWKRVDFVPIVIYDPARPNFAVQYTGESSYTLANKLDLAQNKLAACTYDFLRLLVVTVVLGACVLASQKLFSVTYPDPLSVWELASIRGEENTFITECLDECTKSGCFKQCQNRQMRLVYEEAGYKIAADPDITPNVALQKAHDAMTKAREIIATPGESCHQKAQKIQEVALMPENLSQSFWTIYGQKAAFDISKIEKEYQAIADDVDYFSLLCDAEGACSKNSAACPEPPSCSGSASLLKSNLCAFSRELKIPDIED